MVWLGWILTLSTVTAGIFLPLDMSVAVTSSAVTAGILLPLDVSVAVGWLVSWSGGDGY